MIITAADAETKQIVLKEISAKWDKFFEQDLSSLKGNNDRGNARRKKGDLDGAIKDYAEAIRLYAVPYNNRGLARRRVAASCRFGFASLPKRRCAVSFPFA